MDRIHIVQVGSVLVATLGDEVDDDSALLLQEDIGARVVQSRARGVLIDISTLDIVDSFICKVLGDTAKIVRVLGADVALVGMRPAVAITLVELGLPMDGVAKARNIDHGLRLLESGARGPGRTENGKSTGTGTRR